MKTEKFNLWKNTPGMCEEVPTITYFKPDKVTSKWTVVIFAGGAYFCRAPHEGKGYAEFLSENGIKAFVVDYRVSPHHFPLPLLDARRGVRFVRYYADKFGIDKDKVAVMGSSAGGHLAALESTYYDKIDFEGVDDIDKQDFIPNAQILAYPVIKLLGVKVAHVDSGINLLGYEDAVKKAESVTPELIVSEKTPMAFIWHTFADEAVPVVNSLDYAKALKSFNISTELHIFPDGRHGLGLADGEDDNDFPHVKQWGTLLLNWLKYKE